MDVELFSLALLLLLLFQGGVDDDGMAVDAAVDCGNELFRPLLLLLLLLFKLSAAKSANGSFDATAVGFVVVDLMSNEANGSNIPAGLGAAAGVGALN